MTEHEYRAALVAACDEATQAVAAIPTGDHWLTKNIPCEDVRA